jgi:carboxypeptidase Taq
LNAKLDELKSRLLEISDLTNAASVLSWDQSTYMPPGGAAARARQISTLERLAHEKFTDPAVGKLLDELQSYAANLPFESDEASLIRVTRREYERAVKVPPSLRAEISSHSATTFQMWTEARPANDFARLQPNLEKTLDLSRKLADCFPGYDHIADPLIDFADYGMRRQHPRCSPNCKELVPLVEAITAQPPADDTCLRQFFPKPASWRSDEVIKWYDSQRGRQDKTYHPFMTAFAGRRAHHDSCGGKLPGRAVQHPAGRALYNRTSTTYEDAAGRGTSAGVHESQSRLWKTWSGAAEGYGNIFT